jgi:hypothetical protein
MVLRSWAKNDEGLRIMDLETRKVRVLTTDWDNMPGRSLAKGRIVFTCKQKDGKNILWNSSEYGFKDEAALYDNSFQPYGQAWSMNPDGSNKKMLTDSRREDSMPAFVPPASQVTAT